MGEATSSSINFARSQRNGFGLCLSWTGGGPNPISRSACFYWLGDVVVYGPAQKNTLGPSGRIRRVAIPPVLRGRSGRPTSPSAARSGSIFEAASMG